MTKQPTNSVKPKSASTFQDNLFQIMKLFWKAGYSYGKTGRNEDFYARIVEDFMMLPEQEFLEKYGN